MRPGREAVREGDRHYGSAFGRGDGQRGDGRSIDRDADVRCGGSALEADGRTEGDFAPGHGRAPVGADRIEPGVGDAGGSGEDHHLHRVTAGGEQSPFRQRLRVGPAEFLIVRTTISPVRPSSNAFACWMAAGQSVVPEGGGTSSRLWRAASRFAVKSSTTGCVRCFATRLAVRWFGPGSPSRCARYALARSAGVAPGVPRAMLAEPSMRNRMSRGESFDKRRWHPGNCGAAKARANAASNPIRRSISGRCWKRKRVFAAEGSGRNITAAHGTVSYRRRFSRCTTGGMASAAKPNRKAAWRKVTGE
jgi:hypothetical protein